MNNYNVLKVINTTEDKRISLIELDNKKYILKEVISNNETYINMLKNEVNQLHLLASSGVTPKVITYEFNSDANYLIMEVVKGKPINQLNLNLLQKLKLMLKIIDAVKIIHDNEIVHADLKPANILIDVNNKIKIIDFDISIYNNKNYFKGYGSRHYCSVNHLIGKNITKEDDIYSLGIIFYELMLCKLPFDGSIEEIKNQKLNCQYEKSNNELLNNIFENIFNFNSSNKYNDLNVFKKDIINYINQLHSS